MARPPVRTVLHRRYYREDPSRWLSAQVPDPRLRSCPPFYRGLQRLRTQAPACSMTLAGTSYRSYQSARSRNKIPKADEPCHLCGWHHDDDRTSIVVDHCHACGIIRGIICGFCNRDMWYADQAAGNFPWQSWGRYKPERNIPSRVRDAEIDEIIGLFRDFLDRVGACRVFDYHDRCNCKGFS